MEQFGEVYTNEREVKAMLDLVRSESLRIDSRFLEPACGNGNFLVEILRRKLSIVMKKYKNNQESYERYAFLAVSSVYGIDILEDNCEESRNRLYKILKTQYTRLYKEKTDEQFLKSIEYILGRNIINGDGLTGLKNGEEATPIIFSEWTMIRDNVKRKDYAMNDMIAYEEYSTTENQILKPRKEYGLLEFKGVVTLG